MVRVGIHQVKRQVLCGAETHVQVEIREIPSDSENLFFATFTINVYNSQPLHNILILRVYIHTLAITLHVLIASIQLYPLACYVFASETAWSLFCHEHDLVSNSLHKEYIGFCDFVRSSDMFDKK